MEYFFEKLHIHTIHFIGIGGISMSALSKLCLSYGLKVSGSDYKQSEITDELKNLGVNIFIGHNEDNIKDCDAVVYTIAVGEDNCELVKAKKIGLKVFERSDFLKLVCEGYENVIAVSGTHGKTTTCGMIGSIFIAGNKNPTIHIGGKCKNINGNLKIGGNKFLITEACEYKKHLLKVPHNVGVVLNIEADHLDCYKSINDLHNTFDKFCAMSKNLSVVNEKYLSLLDNNDKYEITTFGSDLFSNYYAKNIRQYKNGKITFDCYKNNKYYFKFQLNLFGKHNVYNALASIAVADYYNVKLIDIYNGLKAFNGVERRFQFMGKINNCLVIQDYAHHPTEIKTTIISTKEIFRKNIIVVFQPHTYSRTKTLFGEFLTCFDAADKIFILPTYPAREKPIKNADGKYLYKMLKKTKQCVEYFNSFSSVYKALKEEKDSIILILGAGDIENLAKEIKRDYINDNNL